MTKKPYYVARAVTGPAVPCGPVNRFVVQRIEDSDGLPAWYVFRADNHDNGVYYGALLCSIVSAEDAAERLNRLFA